MKSTDRYSVLLLIFLMSFFANYSLCNSKDSLDKIIYLQKGRYTVYTLLNSVSDASGYMFIYDSKLVNNDIKIKIESGNRTVKEAVEEILNNKDLNLIVEGRHILICKGEEVNNFKATDTSLTIEGVLIDRVSREPIEFCNIGVENYSLSTISNLTGRFRLKLPDSLMGKNIYISHLGYKSMTIPVKLLVNRQSPIYLMKEIYMLKEVIVKYIDPVEEIRAMLLQREKNYSNEPAILTTFYREGVEYNKKLNTLTEAVFNIYKSPFGKTLANDYVKLLKKSIIRNTNIKDTLVAKIIAGINACLKLDIIKYPPDYLSVDNAHLSYKYTLGRPTIFDSIHVNQIDFVPLGSSGNQPYRGSLYIDSERHALINAIIELRPEYKDIATSLFVAKQGKNMRIIPERVIYTISYKLWNGKYYINHIRGDLSFKVKKRHNILGNSLLHTWFEMVTCSITTGKTDKFSISERIPTLSIFSEDPIVNENQNFWGEFNTIPWEESLIKNISTITSKVEQMVIKQ